MSSAARPVKSAGLQPYTLIQNYFKHRITPKVLSELFGFFFRGFFVILFSEFSEFREFSADAKKFS